MAKPETSCRPDATKMDGDLLKVLRDEASHVKDCFTKYSYYGLLFSSAVLSLILRYLPEYPSVALAGLVIMIFLLSIARIGIYKYGTANRNYGYQLYLERARTLDDRHSHSWKKHMLDLGWEEAMSTWRFVQATVFGHIYDTRPYTLHSMKLKALKGKPCWFEPRTIWEAKSNSKEMQYHAGTYLRTMLYIMYFTIIISFFPMIYMVFKAHEKYPSCWYWFIAPPVLSVFYMYFRIRRNNSKVRILEGGLLSIHSCAIMWQAVVTAHYLALRRMQNAGMSTYRHSVYCQMLAEETKELLKSVNDVEKYIWGS